VRARVREVFVLGALALCLAMAWLTQSLGLSAALGAFLAGVLVSESEYSHQVVADIGPFRDVFASVFFVSIGMLVDLPWAAGHLPALGGAAVAVVVLKATVAGAVVRLLGYPSRTALLTGLGLAQIGEFSFLLMTLGRTGGLLSEEAFQVLLGTAVLTLLATPGLVRLAPALGDRLRREPPAGPVAAGAAGHVVVVGYGVNGSLLARVLEEASVPHVVVELAAEAARRARREGRQAIWGDATRREILERAGVRQAQVVVFAISDAQAVERSIRLARELNRGLEIVVRTRRVHEIERLRRAGADQVVAEEFETAIEIFTRVLARYHVPRHVVRAQTRALRGEGYRMLRAEGLHPEVSQAVLAALAAGTTDIFQVEGASPAAGRTLRDLALRQRSGATVIAVVRGEVSQANPSPEMTLEPGDCLVLVGSHEEIDKAFEVLEGTA
jgi:CPA2 family monovalent cation:H+ antiporter-2